MCGITGFTTYSKQPDQREATLRRMTDSLAHRGPDDHGYYLQPSVCLGHRRLSIIDLSTGHQPMTTSDGRYTVVFNGEIYNYREIRTSLDGMGTRFSTTSDTEVLLELFARQEKDALQSFNGMFAFAIWDDHRQRIFLARDRLGIKPLYYAIWQGELIFGSEMKAILAYPDMPREMNRLSVAKYLTYGYIPAPATIFKNIFKMEPGTYLTYDGKTLEKGMYWDIPLDDKPLNDLPPNECGERCLELLNDAVRLRLRSDVPVGVFLSGGIDSSTIAALAARQCTTRLHTFSIGFEEASYDESPFARMVASQYGTEHHHEVLSASKALELLPEVLAGMDEPFADASILPTQLLSRFTVQHVKVALGGDGGDELFAGYPAFQAHIMMEKLSVLPTIWRNKLVDWARRFPVSHNYASLEYITQLFFRGASISPEIRFFLWLGIFGNDEKRRMLSASVQSELLRENQFEDILRHVHQSRLINDFQRLLYLCMKLYMQDGILNKVDRASMACALEVRVPFLDHNMVEFVSRIPQAYKLHHMTTKYILKHATRDLLPKAIRKRRKAGFMIPLASWLSNELKPMVMDLCSEAEINKHGLFDPAFVKEMLDDHFQQRRDYRKMIWSILVFQQWMRNYA